MTFARVRAADWAALVAALGLLFAMAADWYSTPQGREARWIERLADPQGALGGESERRAQEDARVAAEGAERNAWQEEGLIDRLILVALLVTIALAVAAAFLRAAGRSFETPWTPSGVAAVAAAGAGALVSYRLSQEPGLDVGTTVEAGGPLALVALGALALSSALALRNEEAGRAFRELPTPAEEPAEAAPSQEQLQP